MKTRETTAWTIGLTAAALLWGGAAHALSGAAPTPPGGQLAATAPGGTQGLAGPRNVEEAVRGGQAYPAPARQRLRRPPGSEFYGR